jgi:hypothetical protein
LAPAASHGDCEGDTDEERGNEDGRVRVGQDERGEADRRTDDAAPIEVQGDGITTHAEVANTIDVLQVESNLLQSFQQTLRARRRFTACLA